MNILLPFGSVTLACWNQFGFSSFSKQPVDWLILHFSRYHANSLKCGCPRPSYVIHLKFIHVNWRQDCRSQKREQTLRTVKKYAGKVSTYMASLTFRDCKMITKFKLIQLIQRKWEFSFHLWNGKYNLVANSMLYLHPTRKQRGLQKQKSWEERLVFPELKEWLTIH